ncbi:MAG: acyl carrier protein [Candidatus Thermofonsia Clade 1 bacterium]|jgi:acyl carrier protein|uniref:Acyl carrier protein n=1 Tax=Candidatus Thermofonsia Clade 1 bacterium TaxID=2364210 RepID=A0A2M8PGH9_9CHLR|nr:MAG: acyl carrier protein [Candidatus Thermofonsia Clade 1 bacterium]PJF43349.1 MAG: acyl carrier protein [Candidatus Thermofonsia Clade 1 bacterium]RMF50184.1 MAG: acyl carrier protein [Chloroflexota bacterium]
MATTEERVREIIVELLDVPAERVTLDARFREDLEADSLDLVELIMKIEEEFGGDISDEEAQRITTVGEAVNYIETRIKGSNSNEGISLA